MILGGNLVMILLHASIVAMMVAVFGSDSMLKTVVTFLSRFVCQMLAVCNAFSVKGFASNVVQHGHLFDHVSSSVFVCTLPRGNI